MRRIIFFFTLAILICQRWQPAIAQDENQLPTVDEALAISQATGRPILAMAGQKT